jgi:hypothetical protein
MLESRDSVDTALGLGDRELYCLVKISFTPTAYAVSSPAPGQIAVCFSNKLCSTDLSSGKQVSVLLASSTTADPFHVRNVSRAVQEEAS